MQDILPEWTTRYGPKSQQKGKENEEEVDQERDGETSERNSVAFPGYSLLKRGSPGVKCGGYLPPVG